MKAFVVPCFLTFAVVYALSFTAIGELLQIIQLLVFGEDGIHWDILWFIAGFFGVPFLGYVALVFFPGPEGRREGFLSITGFWVGFGLAMFAMNMRVEAGI